MSVFDKVKEIIVKELKVEAEKVTLDALLKDDLLSLNPNDESYIFDSLCERIKEGHYIKRCEEVCQSYLNQTLAIINTLPTLKPKMSYLIQLLFN